MTYPNTENRGNLGAYRQFIGCAVKKISGKPFLSGLKIGVPVAVDWHTFVEGRASFLMDDGSHVECFRCTTA